MSKVSRKIILLFTFHIYLLFPTYSQSFDEALGLFQQGKYEKALDYFEKLLSTYPNDPEYNYYAGVSLFHLKKDWERCLNYLQKVNSTEPHEKLDYYLGMAQIYLLKPEQGITSLSEYKSSRPGLTLDNKEIEQRITAAKNLLSALSNVQQYQVTLLKTSDQPGYKTYNMQQHPSGTWIQKEDVFFIDAGIKPGTTYIFQPSLMNSNQSCIFFSGKKGLFNVNSNIYKYCETDQFTDKQVTALPDFINTSYNESHAVYIASSRQLYFSSDRPEGLGGYDIYVTTYNPANESWSMPINLGFPVNTPFDEYFLGPGADVEKEFYIQSNRYIKDGLYSLYGLKKNGTNTINLTSHPKLRMIAAQFGQYDIDDYSTKQGNSNLTEKQPIPSGTAVIRLDEEKYNVILEKALTLQLRADSIHRLADEQRFTLSSTEEIKKRMTIIRKIEAFENEADEIQQLADIEFAKARKMELEAERNMTQTADQKPPLNGNKPRPEVDAKVIRERLSGQVEKPHTEATNTINSSGENKFTVHATSVYSPQNPFDMEFRTGNGLLYRIQLGVFSKEIGYDYFGGIWPITGEILENRGLKKYYAGIFIHRSNAEKALLSIRKEGFADAFIVAWFNGNKVSLNRASDIENTIYSKTTENGE